MRLHGGGAVPLLDHQESATVRDRSNKVHIAARGLAAGEHDVTGEQGEQRLLRAGPGVERRGEECDLDLRIGLESHAYTPCFRNVNRLTRSVSYKHGSRATGFWGGGTVGGSGQKLYWPCPENEGLHRWRRSESSGT